MSNTGNYEDLRGKRFYHWLVIDGPRTIRVGEKQKAHLQWLCRCDCGAESWKLKGNIAGGKYPGCRKCWARRSNLDAMIGRKSGYLEVVGLHGHRRNGGQLWDCKCECGNTVVVPTKNLHRTSASCGKCEYAGRRHGADRAGETYGSWTVTGIARRNGSGGIYWAVTCKCGATAMMNAKRLKRAKPDGCRACSPDTYRGDKIPEIQARTCRRIFAGLKRNAEARKIEFSLGEDEIFGLLIAQDFRCALSGVTIGVAGFNGMNTDEDTTASLDRIDSSEGYRTGNVQWVHVDVNRMKWAFEQSYFVDFCKKIAAKAS